MELSIIGLARGGKTTVFKALTGGRAEATASARTAVGVVKVPDQRVDELVSMFRPRKVVPAEVRFVDMGPAPSDLGKGQGLAGPLAAVLSKADAFIHVVRAFDEPSVPHPLSTLDPDRDVATFDLEMAFADLIILERRLDRLTASLRAARAMEKDALLREQKLLAKIKAALETEVPLRAQTFDPEEVKSLSNFQFLTSKPLLLLFNLGEEKAGQADALEAAWRQRHQRPAGAVATLFGKVEDELTQMTPQEAAEFRTALGLPAAGAAEVTRLAYQLLGLLTFYTVGEDEVRAWPVPQGTTAVKAAGRIHSDLEKGFIRAEVVSYVDLMACGSLAEARRRGQLRAEGREYRIQDGDIVTILFH